MAIYRCTWEAIPRAEQNKGKSWVAPYATHRGKIVLSGSDIEFDCYQLVDGLFVLNDTKFGIYIMADTEEDLAAQLKESY